MTIGQGVMMRLSEAWRVGGRAGFEEALRRGLPGSHETDSNGRTALWLAANVGSTEGIESMLRAGANIECRCPLTKKTPLGAAIWLNRIDAARLLISKGADSNARDLHRQTPLMHACVNGHVDAIDLLLASGATVNLQDQNGGTALMMACARGRVAIVRQLLGAGVVLNVVNDRGSTALMMSRNRETLRLLLDHGANASIRDNQGRSVRDLMGHRPPMLALLPDF